MEDAPTEIIEDGEEEEVVTLSEGNGSSSSLRDQLRKRRQEIVDDKTITIDLPGYEGKMAARYRKLEWEEALKSSRRAERSKNPQAPLLNQLDQLAMACEEILIYNPEKKTKENPQGLESVGHTIPGWSGEPIRYDTTLAEGVFEETFKEGEKVHRGIILFVFGNPLAVAPHYAELSEWMQSLQVAEDEDFSDS